MNNGNYRNENQIRKDITKALKRELGEEEVKNIHGSHEYGIDIIFYHKDVFGTKRKYGIQVKFGDIKAREAITLLGQLTIAFGHKYWKDDTQLDGVYIITNGEFIGGADEYIRSASIGFRNIFTIDGNGLKPFIFGSLQQLNMGAQYDRNR